MPAQHCAGDVQCIPGPLQEPVGVVHSPLLHVLLQQLTLVLHGRPPSVHVVLPQTPLVHVPAQHGFCVEQASPSTTHEPQAPPTHELLQHWVLAVHGIVSAMQLPCPQEPLRHELVQHWVLSVHAAP